MVTGVQIYGKLASQKGIVKCVELRNYVTNMKLLTAKVYCLTKVYNLAPARKFLISSVFKVARTLLKLAKCVFQEYNLASARNFLFLVCSKWLEPIKNLQNVYSKSVISR